MEESWSMPTLSADTQEVDGITYTLAADSSINSSMLPHMAFDGNNADTLSTQGKSWHSGKSTSQGNHWFMISVSVPVKIVNFAIHHRYTAYALENHNIKDFVFEGSNDGKTWDSLVENTCLGEPGKSDKFTVENPSYYTQYRIRILTSYSAYSHESYAVIGELIIDGFIEKVISIPIKNGDFEDNLNGWTCTASKGYGVNTEDAYSGHKFYFWSTTGKLYQRLTGLANGIYTVTAMFKQQTGTPSKALFYVNEISLDVRELNSYTKKAITVEVTDGILEFGIDFSGSSANVQADNFEVTAILSSSNKYLIESENVIYTVADGALQALSETGINASLFQTYGVNDIPDGSLLIGLVNPTVMCWTTEELPTINATVSAVPLPQTVISNAIDLTHESITGIENMAATCEGDLIIAVSFDNKQTWKAWNGSEWSLLSEEFTGMNKETLEAITFEQWNLLYNGATGFYIRIALVDTTQSVTEIYTDFAN